MNSLNKILVIGVVRRSKTRKYKKIGQEVQKNSRKNLFISFLNEIKQIDETKQTTTTQKKKAISKITALFMESVSPEIQAIELLLNQVMANESVSLKD